MTQSEDCKKMYQYIFFVSLVDKMENKKTAKTAVSQNWNYRGELCQSKFKTDLNWSILIFKQAKVLIWGINGNDIIIWSFPFFKHIVFSPFEQRNKSRLASFSKIAFSFIIFQFLICRFFGCGLKYLGHR